MESNDVTIAKANIVSLTTVHEIVQTTIHAVYLHYYPSGAIEFFNAHHNKEAIRIDILDGRVYLLYEKNLAAGTVTVEGNVINRLFVLPKYQGQGFGRALMDFSEEMVLRKNDSVELAASLPSQDMYERRGYRPIKYHKLLCEGGDYLCYHWMRLDKRDCRNREKVEGKRMSRYTKQEIEEAYGLNYGGN
jgi:GNAT superfamily N-acetyltransferase